MTAYFWVYFLLSKILVATDFSENADRAIDFAADLAEKLHAPVTIMHVIQNKLPFGMSGAEIAVVRGEDYLIGLKRICEGKIASRINILKAQKQTLHISSIVKIGNPAQQILSEAKSFDILVIGHKGETNLLSSFTGTTSERIVHNAKLPVIVVP